MQDSCPGTREMKLPLVAKYPQSPNRRNDSHLPPPASSLLGPLFIYFIYMDRQELALAARIIISPPGLTSSDLTATAGVGTCPSPRQAGIAPLSLSRGGAWGKTVETDSNCILRGRFIPRDEQTSAGRYGPRFATG